MRSSCYLVVARPTITARSDCCQTHFVTLVARMRFETLGTRKLDSAKRTRGLLPSDFEAVHDRSVRAETVPEAPLTITRERFRRRLLATTATVQSTPLRDQLSLTYNLADRRRLANYRPMYPQRPRATKIIAMTSPWLFLSLPRAPPPVPHLGANI